VLFPSSGELVSCALQFFPSDPDEDQDRGDFPPAEGSAAHGPSISSVSSIFPPPIVFFFFTSSLFPLFPGEGNEVRSAHLFISKRIEEEWSDFLEYGAFVPRACLPLSALKSFAPPFPLFSEDPPLEAETSASCQGSSRCYFDVFRSGAEAQTEPPLPPLLRFEVQVSLQDVRNPVRFH